MTAQSHAAKSRPRSGCLCGLCHAICQSWLSFCVPRPGISPNLQGHGDPNCPVSGTLWHGSARDPVRWKTSCQATWVLVPTPPVPRALGESGAELAG